MFVIFVFLQKFLAELSGLSSNLSPPSEQFSKKQGGIFLAFFKFPIEKKGIFKENQKTIFRFAENKGGYS